MKAPIRSRRMVQIDAEELTSFAASIIEAFGSPPHIAEAVAESLVAADLRGHGSHGVRRLSTLYATMIADDELDPTVEPSTTQDGPTTASVDGHQGWGHYTGLQATEIAIEKAQSHTVGVVGVKNGAHMGRIGEFAERGAEEDMIVLVHVNTGGSGKNAAVPGTTDRNISVNPYAVGIPTFEALDFPLVLDIATGQVAHGKIMKRALAGKELPEDWAIDDTGAPLHDAQAYEDGVGAILPLGGEQFGHKGAAFSLALELVAGLIGDSPVHGEEAPYRVNNGAAIVAVDPEWFMDREACADRVATLAEHLRGLDYDPELVTTPGRESDHPLLPGEPEYELRRDREANGIPMDKGAIANLSETAADHGVSDLPSGF